MDKVDFVGACLEWASGLSLAAEQSIGRSLEAWIGRFYKVDFVEEGHVQSGQVGFPLLLNKTRKWVEKFGSATIYVVRGLAQPSYSMGHILEEPHEHADVSTYLGSPELVVYANGTEAGGQRVVCFWPMGRAPSGIQTTHRSSVAPKTGGFTLVRGVELGHRDFMGCIPTLY